jgi:hypothetical protein
MEGEKLKVAPGKNYLLALDAGTIALFRRGELFRFLDAREITAISTPARISKRKLDYD